MLAEVARKEPESRWRLPVDPAPILEAGDIGRQIDQAATELASGNRRDLTAATEIGLALQRTINAAPSGSVLDKVSRRTRFSIDPDVAKDLGRALDGVIKPAVAREFDLPHPFPANSSRPELSIAAAWAIREPVGDPPALPGTIPLRELSGALERLIQALDSFVANASRSVVTPDDENFVTGQLGVLRALQRIEGPVNPSQIMVAVGEIFRRLHECGVRPDESLAAPLAGLGLTSAEQDSTIEAYAEVQAAANEMTDIDDDGDPVEAAEPLVAAEKARLKLPQKFTDAVNESAGKVVGAAIGGASVSGATTGASWAITGSPSAVWSALGDFIEALFGLL